MPSEMLELDEVEFLGEGEIMEEPQFMREPRSSTVFETDAKVPEPFVNVALDAMGLALIALGFGLILRK